MKKIKPRMKIFLSVVIISAIIIGGTFSYLAYELSKIKTTKISKTDADLGINSKISSKEDGNGIINIALFGLDRTDVNEQGRSDMIMILTIDEKHKKIKMSSIMRDTYVQIKDHGKTKINHAYAYGGPQLAIRTLNENFNLDIRNYVTVDFFVLEKLIDNIGAVTIDIKQDEIDQINIKINEVAKIEKKSVAQITKPGPQALNGLQAVAYSRVRFTAGGDSRRTERQRTLLQELFTKIQTLGVTKFPAVVPKLLPFTETSMNSMEIIKLGTKVFTSNITTLGQGKFPVDGYYSGKTIDKVWYLVADMEATIKQLHKFIYEDIKPVPKAPM